MSTAPVSNEDGFHIVVAEDGSVPAEELSRLGLRPGTRLLVIPEQAKPRPRSARGVLVGKLSSGATDDLASALAETKAEQISRYSAGVE